MRWWIALLVVLAVSVSAQDAEPTDTDLRCLLAEDSSSCPKVAPPAVAKLLRLAPQDLRTALATQGLRWSEVVALRALGPSLLPLLPQRQLTTLPAGAAAELLRRRPDAAGLAALLASAIAHDAQRRRDFLEGVSGAQLGARTEEELGRWAAETFSGQYDDSQLLRRAGTGLLVSLPAARLLLLDSSNMNSFLFSLRSWREFSGARGAATWRRAPALSRHAWAVLALRLGQLPRINDTAGDNIRWSKDHLTSHGFLLDGCAPDAVAPLPAEVFSWPALAQQTPPPLTARAVVDAALASIKDAGAAPPPLNFSLRLAPRQLARLTPGHALRNAWANSLHAGGGARIAASVAPLGSARAAALLLAASSGDEANGAGALAWALPPARRSRLRAPSAAALAALDSPRFSRMEAERLLGEIRNASADAAQVGAWLQARGLLRGLRASALAQLNVEQLPQPLLQHLLRAFPHDATAPAALALLQRVRRHLATEHLLNATLAGAGASLLLGQMTPYELRGASRALLAALPHAPPNTLRALPDRVFWAALDAELGDQLTAPKADSYSPSLLGLRCKHLRAAGAAVAAPLLDSLNAQLRAAKRPFPTALLRCARQSLAELLELRSATLVPSAEVIPPITALRPQDAEAFGGAVVAGVAVEALVSAPEDAARALLASAGRLPLEELIAAAGGIWRARALAKEAAHLFKHEDSKIAAEKEQPSEWAPVDSSAKPLGVDALDRMGSLRWLLPADILELVQLNALRFVLEAASLESRLACGGADARHAWATLAVEVFGPVESWTAGTLGALSGLVVTLSDEQRNAIPSAAWTDAADALAAAWPYARRAGPRAPSLHKSCAEGLQSDEADEAERSLWHTARKIMEGARQQLRDANVPVAKKQEVTRLREAHTTDKDLPMFQPPAVRVLSVDETAEEVKSRRRRRRETGDLLRATVHDASQTTPAPTPAGSPTQAATTTGAPETLQPIVSSHDDWCGVVQLSGSAAGFALTATDMHAASPEQLRACAETLGALRLSPAAAAAFWERATVGASDAEADWAADAGALLGVAPPRKLRELALRRLDVQAAVAEHLNTEELMTVAAEVVWNSVMPSGSEPLPPAALAATGAALCALSEDALARRAGGAGALGDAAAALGVLPWPGCRHRCLSAIARLLTKSDALGPADHWTATDTDVVGALAAGLRTPFKSLSADAVSGLHPDAIKCIPAPDFEALTTEQAESLRPDAAAAVTNAQMLRVCCDEARAALLAARSDSLPPALAAPGSSSAAGRRVAVVTTIFFLGAAAAATGALAFAA